MSQAVATIRAWLEDRCASRSAALAFYTAFSVAPIVVIAVAVAGAIFGAEAASGAIVDQMRGLIGEAGAELVQDLLANAHESGGGFWATAIAMATLLAGATTAFAEMKDNLDQLWGSPPKARGGGIWKLLRARLLSFGIVLAMAFLLLISLVLSAALGAMQSYLGQFSALVAGQAATVLLTFVSVTLLFAVIFRWLPDRRLAWRDTLVGAAVTGVLFMIGRFAIGVYLGHSSAASSFGAAASLVVLLLWTYYSAMIFFLGAEFIRVRAGVRVASKPRPSSSQREPDHAGYVDGLA